MIVIDKDGVRVESIKGGASSAFENVAKVIGGAIQSEKNNKAEV